MALPSNGVISLDDVRKELNITGPVSLGDSNVRSLAGVSSGKISMKDLYGKSNIFKADLTIGTYSRYQIYREYGFRSYYDAVWDIDPIGNLTNNIFNGVPIQSLRTLMIHAAAEANPSTHAYIGFSNEYESLFENKKIILKLLNKTFIFNFSSSDFQFGDIVSHTWSISASTEATKELENLFKNNVGKTVSIELELQSQ